MIDLIKNMSFGKKLLEKINSITQNQIIILAGGMLAVLVVVIVVFFMPKTTDKRTVLSAKAPTVTPKLTEELSPTDSPVPTRAVTLKRSTSADNGGSASQPRTPTVDCVGPDGKHLYITEEACNSFNRAWYTPTPTPSPVPTDTPTPTIDLTPSISPTEGVTVTPDSSTTPTP